MATSPKTIIYTFTDEAPALATASLLPIIRRFAGAAGVQVQLHDISLAGRILAQFGDHLDESQRVDDALGELGELVLKPEANIIKLPNISASLPQLKAAIAELQEKGFALPDYPDEPATPEEVDIRARYDKVKGSAVNPVIRQGNSDRRAPASVKAYARSHPHSMGPWSADSKTRVVHMTADDFRSNEQSVTIDRAGTLRVEHVADDGSVTVLKDAIDVLEGEVVDATVLRAEALDTFLAAQVAAAADEGLLFSVHLKATMMKVSDPIIFGHVVRTFFTDVFADHAAALAAAGTDPANGLGDVLARLDALGDDAGAAARAAITDRLGRAPAVAMVDSDRGITNLHVPSDVIIDASMPAMIRTSGQMWNAAGEQQDTLAVIPDSSYAGVYDAVIEDCKANGAFDPATMGSVPNVGLMAQKAEEYGSHDKTFQIAGPGVVRVLDAAGTSLMEHRVAAGDIWRACQAKDAPIRDWVRLAVKRARVTGTPAVFWLDATRAHDAQLIAKVTDELDKADTDGLTIQIMAPEEATRYSLERIRRGQDTISVTGNVLRDYLTDLFPIMELGTSAKMLSIVPLMAGGGLFETGAGGSAPKHVQQFVKEGHLRWDSLGEYLALAASLEHLATVADAPKAAVLAATLDRATATLLDQSESPSRKVNEIDDRGSHFHLAAHWARELADQTDDAELAARFAPFADALAANAATILDELLAAQGAPIDIGGYYVTDPTMVEAAMRPSATFNALLDEA